MLIFLIFSLLFLLTSGNEDIVECDLYNQRYPNLTLTKVYSEKTTTICKDKCITYLCAVNFRDPNNNERVYAMGSGCIEDVRDNCEFYIDFGNSAHWYPGPQAIASICVNITGEKICHGTFDACLNYYVSRFPNDPLGWDNYYNITYEPDVDGVRSFNESLNTIHPVTSITTTTPIPDTSTSSTKTTTTVPKTTITTTSLEPDITTTTTSTTTSNTEPDTTITTSTTTVPETTISTTSQEPDTTTHVPNPDTSITSTSQVPNTTSTATPTVDTTTHPIPDTTTAPTTTSNPEPDTTTTTTTPSPDITTNPSPDTLPPCRNGGQSSSNIYAILPILAFIIFDF